MKKFLLSLVAFATALTGFAQTNLWPTNYSVSETWGPNETNPVAVVEDGKLEIDIVANGDGQWTNQVKVLHNIDFDASKYYKVQMSLTSDKDCNGVTIKMDDNTGMIWEDQTIDLNAGEAYVYSKEEVKGIAGNDHKLVLDFGWAEEGTHITVENIMVTEVEHNYLADPACASSGNALLAIDGNTGTRWESAHGNDAEWWMVNYGEPKEFNTIQITWEGAYAKQFIIQGSNDGVKFDLLADFTDEHALTAFPNVQIIEIGQNVSYKYVKFQGVERALPYGYSFYEFETYIKQSDVLTTLDFSAAAAVAKIGSTVALTATPKNQYGATMNTEVTYTVTPAELGTVEGGYYTALKAGAATVTAKAGELTKEVTIFNYDGENVALGKPVTAEGFNEASRLNDGNDGTEWQGDPSNGTTDVDVTCQFVMDLEAAYNLSLVTIHFEGACSDAYTLETSADNETWNEASSFEGTLGINNHTDYLYGENLQNAKGVRYIRFTSTKNSTQWGMKIFEFQAFGTPATSTGINNVNVNENENVYNIAGQRVAQAQKGLNIIGGKKVVIK